MAEAVQKKRIPPRPPAVESKPIIGGRLWIPIVGLSLIGLMANPKINNWVQYKFGPKEPHTQLSSWKIGKEADLRVTLVTADATRLACAHDQEIDGTHCEHTGDEKPRPRAEGAPAVGDRAEIIQPYRTSPENHLILIAGLWAQPSVAMRLHREPPEGVPAKRLNRFDASCRVRFIGEMTDVKLRWEVGASWGKEPRALVARAVQCDVVR
jgi:hypothetical protein